MKTREECQKQLFKLGITLGVSPKLISTRLLSEADKNDMLSGLLSEESLEGHVKLWMQNGMPDYTNGTGALYRPQEDLPMLRYRGNGKR